MYRQAPRNLPQMQCTIYVACLQSSLEPHNRSFPHTSTSLTCHLERRPSHSSVQTEFGVKQQRCMRQSTTSAQVKISLRFEGVVNAAAQLEIVHRRLSSRCIWQQVVKLQESAFRAPAMRSDERTLATVARPHLTLHCGRDVPR